MRRSELVNVDIPHDESLEYHEWIIDVGRGPGFTGAVVHRDAIGRRQPGSRSWRRWVTLRCNNSDCPASAIVSERHIVQEVKGRETLMRLEAFAKKFRRSQTGSAIVKIGEQ